MKGAEAHVYVCSLSLWGWPQAAEEARSFKFGPGYQQGHLPPHPQVPDRKSLTPPWGLTGSQSPGRIWMLLQTYGFLHVSGDSAKIISICLIQEESPVATQKDGV